MRWLGRGALLLGALLLGVAAWLYTPDLDPAALEARYGQPPSQFVMVDGLRLHLRDEGSGPVILLLHGFGSSLHTWDGWAADLKRDHRVIRFDFPGHGLTGPDAKARYSWQRMAEVVELVARQLKLERFTIAGNSMGGAVAWHYALSHPERVERLILVDVAGYPRERPRGSLALQLYAAPGIGHLMTRLSTDGAMASGVRSVYGDPAKATPDLIRRYGDLWRRPGNRLVARHIITTPPDTSAAARLSEIKAPTLVLWGQRDTWIDPALGPRFAADIPGARLVTFAALGHVPMEEAPEETVQAVRAFLKN